MKKIFLLSPIFPYPPNDGSRLRTFQIIKSINKKYQVHLLSFYKDSDNINSGVFHLKEICERVFLIQQPKNIKKFPNNLNVYYPDKNIKSKITKIIKENDYELIQSEKIFMAPYIDFDEFASKVFIIDSWGIDCMPVYQKYMFGDSYIKRSINYLKYIIHKKQEIFWLNKFDFLISITDKQSDFYKKNLSNKNIIEIPNSVDNIYFKESYSDFEVEKNSLIFLGIMNYLPNIDAVKYFLFNIFPLIKSKVKIKLYIVGKNPTEEILHMKNDDIIVTGEVEDVRKYLFKADIFISPLRMGSGLRNKVLQAMAASKPIVATSESCEGLNVKNGRELLIADTPEEFALSILRLLKEVNYKKELGRNAYKFVKDNYSDSVIEKKWLDFYDQILNSNNNKRQ